MKYEFSFPSKSMTQVFQITSFYHIQILHIYSNIIFQILLFERFLLSSVNLSNLVYVNLTDLCW